jgi:hypothetical protein
LRADSTRTTIRVVKQTLVRTTSIGTERAVQIRVSRRDVTLEDPDDTKRFRVVVEPGVDDIFGALADAGWGGLDADDDAFIPISAVTSAATGRVGPEWGTDFAAMIEYARRQGWLVGETAIRAHVESES